MFDLILINDCCYKTINFTNKCDTYNKPGEWTGPILNPKIFRATHTKFSASQILYRLAKFIISYTCISAHRNWFEFFLFHSKYSKNDRKWKIKRHLKRPFILLFFLYTNIHKTKKKITQNCLFLIIIIIIKRILIAIISVYCIVSPQCNISYLYKETNKKCRHFCFHITVVSLCL